MATAEISDIIAFLKTVTAFQLIPESEIRSVSKKLLINYVRTNDVAEVDNALCIIRRGAFEIHSESGDLVDRLADGDCFGISTLLRGNPENFVVTAIEDSLIYCLQADDFSRLNEKYHQFRDLFELTRKNRLKKLTIGSQSNLRVQPDFQWTNTVKSLMSTNLVTISPTESIQSCADLMTRRRVSSVMVIELGKLIGLITDRDLRTRVVAEALPTDNQVAEVMTRFPVTLESEALIMHAHLLMSEKNIHHLPIVSGDGDPVGMVTATDLLKSHQQSPLLLVSEIHRQKTLEQLEKTGRTLPALVANLITAGLTAYDLGEVIATITDALCKKLIFMAQETLGPSELEFAWICFGSQARKDQSLGSDQDNALILEKLPTKQQSEYFQQLSDYVCSGLDQCGFPFCPGNIMACNPDYRLTREQWLAKFEHWIQSPTPKALLNASIFFDLRFVYGNKSLISPLKDRLRQWCPQNQIFIATLARNACGQRPPIGFFRTLVVERSGDHKDQLDLKHAGIALIHDIARTYALSHGITTANTRQRLLQLQGLQILSDSDIDNLKDALSFLLDLRLERQQQAFANQQSINQYLTPSKLSGLQRQQLKSVFSLINKSQEALLHKFSRGMA